MRTGQLMLSSGDLVKMESSYEHFEQVISTHAEATARRVFCTAQLARTKVQDAHFAWVNDLDRMRKCEPGVDGNPDHFKRCGHLVYWLRRFGPLVGLSESQVAREGVGGERSHEDQELLEFLRNYGAEFLAFDLGFKFCNLYETALAEQHGRPLAKGALVTLDHNYVKDICHFLKFKNVSPHALYLVFKALFFGRR